METISEIIEDMRDYTETHKAISLLNWQNKVDGWVDRIENAATRNEEDWQTVFAEQKRLNDLLIEDRNKAVERCNQLEAANREVVAVCNYMRNALQLARNELVHCGLSWDTAPQIFAVIDNALGEKEGQ